MGKVIGEEFFSRDTRLVARDLLGKYIVRKTASSALAFMILEVEAYHGLLDKASHASRGVTARNKVMFGPAGVFYVYLTYGMHCMLNIVCGPKGFPGAVLIRGVEQINGPGRLTKALGINKKFNGRPATIATGLWFELRPNNNKYKIVASKRIGVDYAGPWKDKLFRFNLVFEKASK